MFVFVTVVGGVAVGGVAGRSPTPTPPQLAAIETVSKRLFGFYLEFSLCNQASYCNQGGAGLWQFQETQPPPGCSATCHDSLTLATTLQRNGSWPDINYKDQGRSRWETADHLERVMSLLRSYHCARCGKQAGSAPVLASVHSALDFWLQHDFHNPNWWYVHVYAFDSRLVVRTCVHICCTCRDTDMKKPQTHRAHAYTGGTTLVSRPGLVR